MPSPVITLNCQGLSPGQQEEAVRRLREVLGQGVQIRLERPDPDVEFSRFLASLTKPAIQSRLPDLTEEEAGEVARGLATDPKVKQLYGAVCGAVSEMMPVVLQDYVAQHGPPPLRVLAEFRDLQNQVTGYGRVNLRDGQAEVLQGKLPVWGSVTLFFDPPGVRVTSPMPDCRQEGEALYVTHLREVIKQATEAGVDLALLRQQQQAAQTLGATQNPHMWEGPRLG